jgi:cytochrome b561/polyisoprenoid-binding protein YceI
MTARSGRSGQEDHAMPTTPASRRYTAVAIVLHWLIALAIVFQIILGWRMGEGPKGSAQSFALFQLHKSVGVTILLLSLARLGWRLTHRAPTLDLPRWEALASRLVHAGFYLIMIGLPLTGWVMVSASRIHIPTLLYGVVPWPHLPILPDLAAGPKQAWRQAGEFSHGALVKLTYGLLLLHLAAVAKHQLIDRDAVFSHMAAGARPGWREPRLWLAGAVFLAVVGLGYAYVPAIKPASAPPAAPAQPVAEPVAPAAAPSTAAPAALAQVPAAPVRWAVRKGGTLGFSTAWSGQPIEGRFGRWSAEVLFSPAALDGSRVSVDVDLASASMGDAQRDASLAGEDWFDTAAHPRAVFTATRFRKTGEGRFVASGTLDLHGVKRPLALPFALKIDGDTATAHGVVELDRTAFGVGQGEWAGTDAVPAKVAVSFALTADRAGAR